MDDTPPLGGNGIGSLPHTKHVEELIDDNFAATVKGTDENGKEPEEKTNTNDTDPRNVLHAETSVPEVHHDADRGNSSSLPL